MIQLDLNATVRNQFGKGAARSLRRQGRTPAVLYGPKTDALTLDLESKGFTKSLLNLQRRNAVINLTIEGDGRKSETKHALIKEIQTDPVKNTLVHADFMEISMDAPMTLGVPIKISGKAKGVDMGAEVFVNLNAVLLKGMVLDFPDYIEIDVSPLELGDTVRCKDLGISDSLTLIENEDQMCVSVVMPAKEAEVEETEVGEEGAEEGAEEVKADSGKAAE